MLGSALLAGCGGSDSVAPVGHSRVSAPSKPRLHTVQRGDTVYSIAWRYGLDYRRLAMWNRIREPYTIYPGQMLRLERGASQPVASKSAARAPASTGKSPAAPSSGSSRKMSKGTAATTAKARSPPSSASKQAGSATTLKKSGKSAAKGSGGSIKGWSWPTKGKVVTTFSRSGGKGIDIAGNLGQPIVAASGGRVVYSGSGLIGYGQLIIVKHNKRYLSAYAHNNKMLVKEGDTVAGGQRIAEMGRSGANRAMLHFEIRRDGKPIDPMRHLPK